MGEPEHTDVVVIGMGPGGEYAAGALAEAGLHVTGIEERLVGGECPYFGCIPSKMMIRAGNLIAETRRVPGMAGTSTVTPDWSPVALRIREEATDYWNDKVAADRFEAKGGHLVRGRGTITGPGEVTVPSSDGARVFRARRGIVVNSGTAPLIPPTQGLAGTPYWTNREIIQAEQVPASMIVLGGGAIGTELAQVFSRFGTEVTVVEALPRLVSFEEPEASDLIERIFTREGIKVFTDAPAERIGYRDGCFSVHLGGAVLTAAQLLVATGRRSDLAGLGVAAIGLDPAAYVIATDGWMRAAESVWAIGDVTGVMTFTHVAKYQARIACADIFGEPARADYSAIPRVVFCDPEIAAVGLTVTSAREQGIDVASTSITLADQISRPWTHEKDPGGELGVIADRERKVLIGAWAVSPLASEWIHYAALAIKTRAPLAVLRDTVAQFPTYSEAYLKAIEALDV